MSTEDQITELEEKRNEFILNESVFADDNPSWGELADAQAEAESRWNDTEDGKELARLLASQKKYSTMIIRTNEWGRTWYYVDMKTGNIWYDGLKPSGQWKFLGFSHIRRNQIIKFDEIKNNPELVKDELFWFKNGKSQFSVRDSDHGTTREWGSRILGISFREEPIK